jgi:hypothetical protein
MPSERSSIPKTSTITTHTDEDGFVLEEEEFTELASSEFLAQQQKALLGVVDENCWNPFLTHIHSGLVKTGARGVSFTSRPSPLQCKAFGIFRPGPLNYYTAMSSPT